MCLKTLPKRPQNEIQNQHNFMIFVIDFCIAFCTDLSVSDSNFSSIFAPKNRPRSLSGAKTSTFDFNQPSERFQWFWTSEGAQGVPKSTSKPPPQIDMICCIFWLQKQPQNEPKRAPSWSQNAIKKSCKKRPPK